MTDFGWIRRRQFAAIATARFDSDLFSDLPGVADEVGLIADWLTGEALGERRFARVHQELAADPATSRSKTVSGTRQ